MALPFTFSASSMMTRYGLPHHIFDFLNTNGISWGRRLVEDYFQLIDDYFLIGYTILNTAYNQDHHLHKLVSKVETFSWIFSPVSCKISRCTVAPVNHTLLYSPRKLNEMLTNLVIPEVMTTQYCQPHTTKTRISKGSVILWTDLVR